MPKLTDKNTKSQILEAYNQLLEQAKNQNASIHDPAAEVKAKKNTETLSNAASTVEQSVEDQIAELQKSMQSVLVNLSGSFADKVKEYSTVEEAIALKKAELKEIHDIEAEAFTLAALVNTHKEIEDKFNIESAEKRAQFQTELDSIKTQIGEARVNYQKELQEERNHLQVERQREKEEYEYNFNRDKQKKEDALNDLLAERRKNFNEEVASGRKEISERDQELGLREESVSTRELKIDELEAAVAALPEKEAQLKSDLETAIKAQYAKTAAITENSIKKYYESQELVYKNKIEMLEKQLEDANAKIIESAEKLDKSYEKIQSMAIATTNRPVVEYRQGESK